MKRYIPIQQDIQENLLKKQPLKDSSLKLTNYYHEKENYYPIERDLLLPGEKIVFSLFAKTDFEYNQILEASESHPVKVPSEILDLKADISIKTSDLPVYNNYINSLDKRLNSSKFDEKIRACLIKDKTKLVVKDILSSPKSGENIKKASSAIELILNSILNSNKLIPEIISLKTHDYYTYTHCVNVAVLSLGLGISVNLKENELFNLGLGSLLHDIGKTSTPSNILNKPGRLTPAEYRIMKNHVIEGVKILEEHPNFPKESLTAVAQHHERLSGKGYPFQLPGSLITKYGKITAITDSYDALTTARPTKQPLTPFEALSIIVNDCEHYDSEYLASFIKMLGKFEE